MGVMSSCTRSALALAAIACTAAAGISFDRVKAGLEAFAPVSGRLQRKRAANGAIIIDDTYNANPDSVRAAIDVLANSTAPRVLVLGDMGEVGTQGREFHEEIAAYAASRGIEQVLVTGELALQGGSVDVEPVDRRLPQPLDRSCLGPPCGALDRKLDKP